MVGQVLESHKITFHKDELPPEGLSHNRVLHITVQFEDKFIAKVLIDGGSSLNICPLTTLKRLGRGLHEIRVGTMNMKAFDGSQRATLGEINLCLQIGLTWFDVECQVLDISSTYNLLLGRPWIHAVGAIASTLHQALKFEWNHQEVIIHGDGSNPIYTNQTVLIVENRRKLGGETYHHIERDNAIEKDKWYSNKIEKDEVLAGLRNLFMDDEDMDFSAIVEEEEEDLTIQTMGKVAVLKNWTKLRKFKPDMSLKIKEKVTKKIKAKVLRVAEYPASLANIVSVPKKDGKVKNEYGMPWSTLSEQNVQSFQQKGQTLTIHTGAAGAEADLHAPR
ncbi:uncharacterized protein [Nicotiana sylvestris]|uniref:uncharacterized protein n=1 Tax=Nicotiana sylvestris TaxID=4096 RepID=UPI00388C66CE